MIWQELGLPGLADVHVHFLPEPVMRKVWGFFDAAQQHYGTPWPVQYRLPQDERLAILRALGVRAFPALVYPHKPGMAGWLSSWALDLAAAEPDVVASATFYPEPSAVGEVETALARGARLFKAHVQVGGYDPRDPLLDPVWGLLAEAGVPTVIHCGDGPIPGRHTGIGPMAEVLARHPRLPLVIAHAGAPRYEDFVDLAERHDGVALDTTMVFTDFMARTAPFPAALVPRIRDLGLAGSVMLGTDFPNIPYAYERQIEALVRVDLGDQWLREVLWYAPGRVLGLVDG